MEIITEKLHTATSGTRVVLVEGAAGSGKSRLLSESQRIGRRHQLGIVHGRGDRTLQQIPLSSMLTGTVRFAPGLAEVLPTDAADWSYARHLNWMRALISDRIGTRRLVVLIDDLQWADPVTLLALRVLPHEFAGRAVTWVLARRPETDGDAAAEVFGRLAAAGAEYLLLEGLDTGLMHEVAADLLGGSTTDSRISTLVEGVGGNPALLEGLLDGLLEEGRVAVRDGVARLLGPDGGEWNGIPVWTGPLPARFRAIVSDLVRELDPEARQLVEIGAVLGTTFVPDEAAEMIQTSAGALLLAVRSGISAGLLTCSDSDDELSFSCEAVRRGVLQSIPAPLRTALHRQYAVVLAERGNPQSDATALSLADGARPRDAATIGALRDAAESLMPTRATTAVELGLRALDLTGEHDPERVQVAGTVARALLRVGPLSQVVELSEHLAHRAPAGDASATDLRTASATAHLLEGRYWRALAEIGDAGGTDLRGDPALVTLSALSHADPPEAERRARAIIAHPDVDPLVHSHASVCLARARWSAGHLLEALHFARSAVTPTPVWFESPLLLVAGLLTELCEFDEARSVLDEADSQLRSGSVTVLEGLPNLVRSRLEFSAGHSDAAIAAAEAGLAAAPGSEPGRHASLAHRSLALAALRADQLTAAAAHLERLRPLAGDEESATCAWVRIQFTAAGPSRSSLGTAIESVCRDPKLLRAVVREDGGAAAWLVRQLMKVSPANARTVVEVADELSSANPHVEVVGAAAAHARGLLDSNADLLEEAAGNHRDVWSAASADEDLARLAASPERAVDRLDHALARYKECGATLDMARVRRRLRRLGVRRRHWTYEQRPTSGWNSLTDTERQVSEMVACGLTNRQVAQRMYLSPHTIGFHLRQIYRKLGIRSRVELAGRNQVES
ncbi:hypothetical protein AD006_32425 (plasmid) [Pseudonocardia sp. EC080610-09]|nr:hypothetical protein AD006_32425 [Pseudonocardia sp. EC080610-09]